MYSISSRRFAQATCHWYGEMSIISATQFALCVSRISTVRGGGESPFGFDSICTWSQVMIPSCLHQLQTLGVTVRGECGFPYSRAITVLSQRSCRAMLKPLILEGTHLVGPTPVPLLLTPPWIYLPFLRILRGKHSIY